MRAMAKCLGRGCPIKETCKRFVSPKAQIQGWCMFDEMRIIKHGRTRSCDHQVPIEEE